MSTHTALVGILFRTNIAVIHGFLHSGSTSGLLQMYNAMKADKIQPTSEVYGMLLGCYGRLGQEEQIEQVLSEVSFLFESP